jgi:hypothetical protein
MVTSTPEDFTTMAAPFLNLYTGPRGPSGVMATDAPSFNFSTIAEMAETPFRLLDPRIDFMPTEQKISANHAPSLDGLMRP